MKVLIHALGSTMGGGVRHLTSFLPELGNADPENEYVVLARDIAKNMIVAPNVQIEVVPEPRVAGRVRRLYGDVVDLPRRLKREGFDAVVSLMNFGPIWSPVPHILFQRNSIYFCPHYLSVAPPALRVEALARKRLASASMTRAAMVVTPTDAMQGMIKSACPETESCRFRTLYHGFDAASMTVPSASGTSEYSAILDGAQVPVLFFPSHLWWHKGFEILFRTIAVLRDRGAPGTLVVTIDRSDGPAQYDRIQRLIGALRIGDRVLNVGRVPQDQIAALYKRADLMVYPSLCESFGFSMVEAMGHGLPIVAAGTPVNRELCGEGAYYYESLDPSAAADQITRALDSGARAHLRSAGRTRMAGFEWGWKRYAREFAQIVSEV